MDKTALEAERDKAKLEFLEGMSTGSLSAEALQALALRFLQIEQLLKVMKTRGRNEMESLIYLAIASRGKDGTPCIPEIIDFLLERLLTVLMVAGKDPKSRNNKIAQALYISGRRNKDAKHSLITQEIIQLEFHHRNKSDPLTAAIRDYHAAHPDQYKNERTLRDIVKKNYESVCVNISYEATQPMKDWLAKKIQ